MVELWNALTKSKVECQVLCRMHGCAHKRVHWFVYNFFSFSFCDFESLAKISNILAIFIWIFTFFLRIFFFCHHNAKTHPKWCVYTQIHKGAHIHNWFLICIHLCTQTCVLHMEKNLKLWICGFWRITIFLNHWCQLLNLLYKQKKDGQISF